MFSYQTKPRLYGVSSVVLICCVKNCLHFLFYKLQMKQDIQIRDK